MQLTSDTFFSLFFKAGSFSLSLRENLFQKRKMGKMN
jgi:hypothetical protein